MSTNSSTLNAPNVMQYHLHVLYKIAYFQIYRKCLDCVCTLLPEVLSSSCHSEESPVKSDLCRIRDLVQRNFCSMGWEFRDTSCEFVRDLLEKYKGKQFWMLHQHFQLHFIPNYTPSLQMKFWGGGGIFIRITLSVCARYVQVTP